MSYNNKYSNKPFEYASKTSHTNIINDKFIKEFLSNCSMPPFKEYLDYYERDLVDVETLEENPINNIITIDGGYTNTAVKETYPSSTITFFQFGVLIFKSEDLISLKTKPFIEPEDFSKLQNIQRLKFALPTKGISIKSEKDLVSSVRKSLYDFFLNSFECNGLMKALKWLLFEEFNKKTGVSWHLAKCPNCSKGIDIKKNMIESNYTFKCPKCGKNVYLTDCFRLHEVVDNEFGATGILGYLSTSIEQLIIVFLIKLMLEKNPSLLKETLIIKDGPLAFFGQTANVHKPMRELIKYLDENYEIYLVGLEKSGAFVEHAEEITDKIGKQKLLIMNNEYIYRHIIPGPTGSKKPYGSSTYYGNKVIYKSKNGDTYVATIPTLKPLTTPSKSNFLNIDIVLNNVSNLKCDLYYNSLVPIVLANKLVSLSDHPSAEILTKFAKETTKNGFKNN